MPESGPARTLDPGIAWLAQSIADAPPGIADPPDRMIERRVRSHASPGEGDTMGRMALGTGFQRRDTMPDQSGCQMTSV